MQQRIPTTNRSAPFVRDEMLAPSASPGVSARASAGAPARGSEPSAPRGSDAPQEPGKPEHEGEIVLEERPETKEPRRFVVVFHNDDYTTQEFVVQVLMHVFHKDASAATQIMLQVHHRGWGVAGVYSRDVAETKVEQVHAYAREKGHPLRVTAEPEGYGEDES